MEFRQLGRNEIQASALGLGCMGMSFAYGPANDEESLKVLHRYLDLGGNFLDTAEIYGPYKNEELLGRFLREIPREKVVVATKFGFRIAPDGSRSLDSSPQNVRRACDASLSRLGIDTIDLFYQHRVDPNVPIEETVGAMAGLVTAGKVLNDLDSSDWRRTNYPRFQAEALQANLKLAAAVKELAKEKGITPAQLALAWVLAQGKDIVPIPGTKRVRYLEENMGALNVHLTAADLKQIAARLAEFQIVGERYTPQMMALVQNA